MTIEQISSAIYTHLVSGLSGMNANPKISMEQLQDEVVAERDQLIKEYLLNGVINLDDLLSEKYNFYAHLKKDKKETLKEHTKLCEKYFNKLIRSKRLDNVVIFL